MNSIPYALIARGKLGKLIKKNFKELKFSIKIYLNKILLFFLNWKLGIDIYEISDPQISLLTTFILYYNSPISLNNLLLTKKDTFFKEKTPVYMKPEDVNKGNKVICVVVGEAEHGYVALSFGGIKGLLTTTTKII